ncbi:MAG: hypothetical protein Q8Q05_01050 [bacterium]|nr:hypothetical protein [bacterium]
MEEVKTVNVNVPRKAVVINSYKEHSGGWVYFLGTIGSFVYFLQSTNGFEAGVLAFLKALVWPAYLVYHIFKFLGV